MAKDSKLVYGASGKTNVLTFEPENLHLVTDKTHPLYDERVNLPIDEGMVLNIKELGVLEPIIVWKDPEKGLTCVVGPLKHLSKEALEAAAEPDDLSEWADMQFLLWDAQRRAGITDEQITQAMIEKLAVNKQRSWPEPKEGEPRLHIKEQPAPEKYNIGDATIRHIFTPTGMTNVSDMQAVFDRVEAVLVGMEQPAPVVPDGYVMVPMRLTAENGAKGALSGEFSETKLVNCPECFGDDECETCDGSGKIEITVPVTWTTIKAIWVKGVEHFAATAQEND